MFPACEGVRPDVRGCGLHGRPVGSRKRHLFVCPGPWMPVRVPAWMTGVDGRCVVSSHGATERDEHATPCDRYAPVVDAACEVRGGVLAACLVWEVVACVEDIKYSGPVDVGSCVDGEGGALCDDVTKEEQCDAVHDVQCRG